MLYSKKISLVSEARNLQVTVLKNLQMKKISFKNKNMDIYDKMFKGTVINQTCYAIKEESLEIMSIKSFFNSTQQFACSPFNFKSLYLNLLGFQSALRPGHLLFQLGTFPFCIYCKIITKKVRGFYKTFFMDFKML